ncbi:MAG: lytic transglycosylase domain-containing protein [Pseudomonadota bacterium]
MNLSRPPRPGQRVRLPGPDRGKTGSPKAAHDWFWKAHSPAASAATPGRWQEALETLRRRRAQGSRILSDAAAARIAAAWRPQIAQAARAHRVSEALILAVIAVESRGQAKATSPKAAQGLMQLIPATAQRFGVSNAYDPAQNLMGGAAYLAWLLERFRGDLLLALAGYNAGENAVAKHSGVPPYAETRDYVVKVLDALAAAEPLCQSGEIGLRRLCAWPATAPATAGLPQG